jgi:hypothetical protein
MNLLGGVQIGVGLDQEWATPVLGGQSGVTLFQHPYQTQLIKLVAF